MVAIFTIAVWSATSIAVFKPTESSMETAKDADTSDELVAIEGWALDDMISDACEGSMAIVHAGASDNGDPYLEQWSCGFQEDDMAEAFEFMIYESSEVAYHQASFTDLYDAYFVSELTDGRSVLGVVWSVDYGEKTFPSLEKSNAMIDELAAEYAIDVYRIPHDPESQY